MRGLFYLLFAPYMSACSQTDVAESVIDSDVIEEDFLIPKLTPSLRISSLNRLSGIMPGFTLLFEFLGTQEVMRLVGMHMAEFGGRSTFNECAILRSLNVPYLASGFSVRHPFIKDINVALICCGRAFRLSPSSRQTVDLVKRIYISETPLRHKRRSSLPTFLAGLLLYFLLRTACNSRNQFLMSS